MRLLTINIQHGGGLRAARIASFIVEQSADVVVLTEYRRNESGQKIVASLNEHGYNFQTAASHDAKQNSVCILSRTPFRALDLGWADADSHRLLAAQFTTVTIAGVYFPLNEAKRLVFERLKSHLLPQLGSRGVVLGDFNTGKPFEDEASSTFLCADCFDDLLSAGLVDSWRRRNPNAKEFSWYSRANNGFRIDHALCTPDFDKTIREVRYIHEPRISRMTDHSALLVQCDA